MNVKKTSRIRTLMPVPPFDKLPESDQVMALLKSELLFVEKRINAHPKEQRWRRIFVRSLFAFIEGCAYRLRQDAMGFKEFPTKELQVLKEKEYRLNEKGEISEGDMHIQTLANLRYSFNAYGRAFAINGALDISDNRWDSLERAQKIRDRITHPKDFDDLVITGR